MDNRINEIRRKISVLRADMLRIEDAVRKQINHDLDCTESSLRLMAMWTQLAALVAAWKSAGGAEPMPTVEQRLKVNHRPPQKLKAAAHR